MIAVASLAGWATDMALVLPVIVLATVFAIRHTRRRTDRAWEAMWGPRKWEGHSR